MLLAVTYALAASLSWGIADFGAGLKTRTLPLLVVVAWMQGLGLLLAAVYVVATGAPPPSAGQAAASLAAGAAGVIGLAAFYRALATGTMSVVAPIAATGVVLPVLVGVLGGDRISGLQACGLAAATVGVLAASRQPPGHGRGPGERRAQRRSIGLALVAAVCFGSYFTGSHEGVRGGLAWLLLLSHGVACVGVLGVAAAIGRRPAAPRAEWAPLIVVGLLDFAATVLYGLANRAGLLSIVAVVGSLYPVATVMLARIALHERVGRVQAAGIALALAGVALIGGG
jgi:drug/metabolite transporter (DMT)-like permease